MKVISFCLWGDDPKYTHGALRNAQLAKQIFPDWECWFYCRNDADDFMVFELEKMSNVKVVYVNMPGNWTGMFDRFLPMTRSDVEVCISRDCDSRLSRREAAAIQQWVDSDKGFHIMHDHPHHSVPILGGMWGMKRGCLPEFGKLLHAWLVQHGGKDGNYWQVDQDFLTQIIWPKVHHDTMNHASFLNHVWPGIPFPRPRKGDEFVGATYDRYDNIDAEQVRLLHGG